MRTVRRLLFLSLLVFLSIPATAQVEPGQTYSGRVVDVTDGDTFDIQTSTSGEITVRLWGVDTPETSQSYGSAATNAARRYVGGKNVRVSVQDVGRYGRAIARIEVGGGDLSSMLVRDGLAWHYNEYAPNATELSRLEMQVEDSGHRPILLLRGNGGIVRVEDSRLKTRIVRILRPNQKPMRFSRRTNPGTLTTWTGTGTGKHVRVFPLRIEKE